MNEEAPTNVRLAPEGAQVPQVLRGLAVGERVAFPADRSLAVRSSASSYGFAWGKVFRTRIDRLTHSIVVERVE